MKLSLLKLVLAIILTLCSCPQKPKARSASNRKTISDSLISEYSEALKLNPNYAEAYNNRGIAYCGKGEYDRAIADYNRALELNPNLAQVMVGLGLCYQAKGEAEKARKWYQKAWEERGQLTYAQQEILRGLLQGLK